MTARQTIDEVEGLSLRITMTVRESGSGMKFVATVPTGVVPADIIRQWLKTGRPNDERDGQFLTQNIGNPVKKEFISQLRRRGAMLPRAQFNRIKDEITQAFGLWSWPWPFTPMQLSRRSTFSVELINPDGSPYDQQKFNRQAMSDLLGEGDREPGWVDPNGVLVPGDLFAQIGVMLLLHDGRNPGEPFIFEVRCRVPHDVEWDKVQGWVRGHVGSAFGYGPPYNLTNIIFLKKEVESKIHAVSADYVTFNDHFRNPRGNPEWVELSKLGTEIKWVNADGTPYPTGPVQRRHVKRKLSEVGMIARRFIDQICETPEYIIGNPKRHYDASNSGFVRAYSDNIKANLTWGLDQVSASAYVADEAGHKQYLEHTVPLPADLVPQDMPAGAGPGDYQERERIKHRLENNPRVKELMAQCVAGLRQKIQNYIGVSRESRPELKRVKRPKTVKVDGSALPLIRDFRFMRVKPNIMSNETVMQMVNSAMKPGDEIISVEGGGYFFVMLSPEEKAEFERRVRLNKRQKVGRLLDPDDEREENH